MSKKSKKLLKRAFALMLALVIAVPTVDYSMLMTVNATEGGPTDGVTAIVFSDDSKGYEEGAYVKWSQVDGANGYQVYVSKDENVEENEGNLIDDELIRKYPDYYRADVLGLTEGTWYVKVVAGTFDASKNRTAKKAEGVKAVEVTSHDRSGFAWQGYADNEKDDENINTPGAYKKDGTLKDDTSVIYVTNASKNAVTLKGDDGTEYVGLQNILNAYKSLKLSKPLDVRIIGNVEDFDVMDKGDIAIENGNRAVAGITIEGVGEDAVANGWGIRVLNASNVEIRNLGFMNCNSIEGDNIGVQQDNDHVWVHNCDFFYGEAGTDDDQKKGDGMLDCKKSDWVTFSYNHFWDSGKSCLLGLEENSNEYHATYHHNWFDHSDSRHPRVRFYTTHVYNNYYDGISKYGIGGAAGGASIFVENNYFRNCKYPMIISMQGSDTGTLSSEEGSIIKAYGNYMIGQTSYIPYQANIDVSESREEESGFVAYVALDDEASINIDVDDTVDASEDSTVITEEIADSETDEDADKEDTEASDNDVSVKENASDEDSIADEETKDSETGEAPNDEDAEAQDIDGSTDENETEILDDDSITDYGDAEVSYANSGDASIDFDAYEASSRDEKVPNTVKAKNGGHTYNNFDTEPGFYSYKLDEADKVKEIVKESAGRVNGGDFPGTAFSFNDSDDKSSSLNQALKDLCTNYTSSLVSVGGVANEVATVYYTITFDPNNGEDVYYVRVEENSLLVKPADPEIIPDGKEKLDGWYNVYRKWDFENDKVTGNITLIAKWLSEGEDEGSYGVTPIGTQTVVHSFPDEMLVSPYFDFKGEYNTKAGGSGTYEGLQYSSSTRGRFTLTGGGTVTFKTTTSSTLVLLLSVGSTKKHKIDNTSYGPNTNNGESGFIKIDNLPAGDHTILGNSTDYLFAIIVIPNGSEFVYDDLKYNVSIELDGGTSTVTSPLAISKGYSITKEKLPDPIKDGFIFKGWIDEDGKSLKLPYQPTGNMTIKATWKTAETYTVNIDLDGGTSDTIPSSLTVYAGDSIDLSKLGTPTKDNCTFQGWVDADDNELGETYTPAGDTTIKAKWKERGTTGGLKIQFKNEDETYTYTGSAINPEIIVTNGGSGKELTEGIDYTVKYSNNIKASSGNSKAKITVTGKGNLSGSTFATFTIEQKSLAYNNEDDGTDEVTGKEVYVADGAKATLSLSYGGTNLTTKDYEFKNTSNKTKKWKMSDNGTEITIIGKGNFTGERPLTVKVLEKEAQKNAKITVKLDSEANKNLTYKGEGEDNKVEPVFEVTTKSGLSSKGSGEKALKESTDGEDGDYIVSYPEDMNSAGKKKFTVIGISERCVGTVTKTYTVKPAPKDDKAVKVEMDDAEVTASTSLTFVSTGSTFTQEDHKLKVTYNDTTLVEGKDYKIAYSGNKKVGNKAKYTITGL
ncbi:MAG: InlB B-repeat-containing protein, partial [Lachnospiraceae bacterium]|nr:InlB B-repeat-containing protein [Lachnospiraceae bacterium]